MLYSETGKTGCKGGFAMALYASVILLTELLMIAMTMD